MGGDRVSGSVKDVLDRIDDLATEDGRDEVSVGDMIGAIGNRGFGPPILLCALIEETPIGAVPFVPTFIATVIAIFAVQLMMARTHVWLPGILANRSVSAHKVQTATQKLRGIAGWMDRHFDRWLAWFAGRTVSRAAGVVILLLCLTVPPLELVPWASSVPMLAVASFGLAMTVRDGLIMLVAFAGSAGAIGLGLYLLTVMPGA